MAAMTLVSIDEADASALWRYFNARMDSSSDLILASIVCRRYSPEFAWLGSSIIKPYDVKVCSAVSVGCYRVATSLFARA